jgi:DHA3 family macrolide efflux protein-like MFS transporter
MATPAAQLGLGEVIKLKPVRKLWLAQVVSVFGDFLAVFAVISVVTYKMHGTAAQITLITVSFMLPFALISPVAGVFVDRWNVKQTMIASDLIRAVLALLLVFATNLNQIYAILFVLSAVSTFFVPAQSVTLRTVVPKEGLMAANTLIQQAFQVMRIISPAMAGAMVAWFGANSCYVVDSVSFVCSATLIGTVLIVRQAATPAPKSEGSKLRSVITDMGMGLKFIFTHSIITFVILSMAAGMFALSCFGPLIAVYVRDELNAGSVWFGIINAMIGVGMILGSLVLNKFAQKLPKSQLVIWGLLVIAVFVVVMASFKNIPMAAVGTFGIGVGIVFIIVAAQTLMQQRTPIELVGRVSSSFMSVLSVAQLFGLVFSGSLAQVLGIRTLFFASAGLLVIIACFGYFRLPPAEDQATHQ